MPLADRHERPTSRVSTPAKDPDDRPPYPIRRLPAYLGCRAAMWLVCALSLVSCGEDAAGPTGRGVNVRPVAWQIAQVAPDGRSVRLFYFTGPDGDLVDAEVRARPGRVVVTLLERTREGGGALVRISGCGKVQLEGSEVGREIVDGATGRSPRGRPPLLLRKMRRGGTCERVAGLRGRAERWR